MSQLYLDVYFLSANAHTFSRRVCEKKEQELKVLFRFSTFIHRHDKDGLVITKYHKLGTL